MPLTTGVGSTRTLRQLRGNVQGACEGGSRLDKLIHLELIGSGIPVQTISDAISPGNVDEATYTGEKAARLIA